MRACPPAALRVLMLLAPAALAACGTPDGGGELAGAVGGMDQATAALRAARAGVEPWNAPSRPAASAAATVAQGAVAEAGPPVAFANFRAAPLRDTSGLLGATAPAVVRALGQPELRRRDGDAEAWLYRGATCLLDVVLYPDPAIGREPRVAFAAARAAGLERVPEQACLSEITRAHQLVARARE
jgi:hypothetical protein